MVGMAVCLRGKTSGLSCGEVLRIDQPTFAGTAIYTDICAAPGDSGGPIVSTRIDENGEGVDVTYSAVGMLVGKITSVRGSTTIRPTTDSSFFRGCDDLGEDQNSFTVVYSMQRAKDNWGLSTYVY